VTVPITIAIGKGAPVITQFEINMLSRRNALMTKKVAEVFFETLIQAGVTTEVTKVGNVVVDVFDARTQNLLWHGTDSQDLSSNADKNIQKLQKDINNMFKHFPPK
jgi:hypothetical protein